MCIKSNMILGTVQSNYSISDVCVRQLFRTNYGIHFLKREFLEIRELYIFYDF